MIANKWEKKCRKVTSRIGNYPSQSCTWQKKQWQESHYELAVMSAKDMGGGYGTGTYINIHIHTHTHTTLPKINKNPNEPNTYTQREQWAQNF